MGQFPDLKATADDAKKLGFNFVKKVDILEEVLLREYIKEVIRRS